MKRRTIFFLTLSLLIILALVQATLVSAEEPTPSPDEGCDPTIDEGCETDVPTPDYVCNPEEEVCEDEEQPTPPTPDNECNGETGEGCDDGGVTPKTDECLLGNPGNFKCVGKAGEKKDMGGFWAPSEGGDGTHGRSNPDKHKPHPSMTAK
jgi:hypothetical protein